MVQEVNNELDQVKKVKCRKLMVKIINKKISHKIQFSANQMNKAGPFVEFYMDPAYSSGLQKL